MGGGNEKAALIPKFNVMAFKLLFNIHATAILYSLQYRITFKGTDCTCLNVSPLNMYERSPASHGALLEAVNGPDESHCVPHAPGAHLGANQGLAVLLVGVAGVAAGRVGRDGAAGVEVVGHAQDGLRVEGVHGVVVTGGVVLAVPGNNYCCI